MKVFIYFILFFFFINDINAQASFDVDEGKPYINNGLEYGFEIRNESKKEVKKEDYSRYEITAYVTNKSGCTKIMFPNRTIFGSDFQDVLADFACLNATGKRLTSKSAKVRAKDFNAPYTYTTKGADGKDIKNNVTVKVGNMLRNGETVTNNFIVIVPEGERPHFKVRISELVD